MHRLSIASILAFSLILGGCGASYTIGFTQEQVSPAVWHLRYSGLTSTTSETVQTFWLYHAAQLTLEKGYDGFRIIVPPRREDSGNGYDLPLSTSIDAMSNPEAWANIVLLRKPFRAQPPVVFDAATLSTNLKPIVEGASCGAGNVCPHIHTYLMPDIAR